MTKVIYVSSPYTGTPEQREERYLEVETFCTIKIQEGFTVFSPIVHNHQMLAHNPNLPITFDFWNDYCLNLLHVCDEMWVVTLDGWESSKGITGEMAFAHEYEIPVTFYDPLTCNPITARELFR